MTLSTADLRNKFIDYFKSHGHQAVASSSLVPADDPTLLFTNAGMNQFKDCFLGAEKRSYTRAVSSQRCVRAGGKHNDLENVGYTARHHTFFEMLGNFSFGDYFKKEAIEFAWNFLTKEIGLPKEKLLVTVYSEDDEAFDIWENHIGVPKEKIIRISTSDNFWSMGDTGPCGPCSEIFYDHGAHIWGGPPGTPEEDGDRFIEIWNLVFMQFDRDGEGELTPLPNPSIDTGMGLERICSVMQKVTSNYDTDLFTDIMNPVAAALGCDRESVEGPALRVIADHLRAMAFLIADGVRPSNEGRGYELRRIMRRAMRFGKQLGQSGPFLHRVVGVVIDKMGAQYPELNQERQQIELLIEVEEQQFDTTLTKGMPIFLKYLEQLSGQGLAKVPGQVIHFMYGTHGFPVDLMADIARDAGLTLDQQEFQQLMDEETRAAQAGAEFSAKRVHPLLVEDAGEWETEQTCHRGLEGQGVIRRILAAPVEGGEAENRTEISVGDRAELLLDRTSFYAESGGQVGDHGWIRTKTGAFEVEETTRVLDKLVLHQGVMREGRLSQNQNARTEVDAASRRDTMKNHTATHLLHQALRDVLGLHVRQAGSLVDPEKLRFDFSHFSPLTAEHIADIEALVNRVILDNIPVDTEVMDQESARKSGAIAFFGEKYGARVRVVGVGDFSKEFCGGTHVRATGEIGCFKIVSERGLAAGVRRLVALTGPKALARFQESEMLLKQLQDRFSLHREGLAEQVQRLIDERKALEAKVEALKMSLAKGGGASERNETLSGLHVVLKQVSDIEGGQLRQLADELLGKAKGGVVLLGSDLGEKVQLIVKTGSKAVHAGELVREMAAVVGGKGGGRPDMAMAGGKDASQLAAALETGFEALKTKLGG